MTNMSICPFPGMYHTCAICAPLAEVLAPVTGAFESGIGAALKSLGGDLGPSMSAEKWGS